MSIEPQTPAKSLTQMVATQIKLQMVLADDIKQSQLARKMGRTEQWLSVRLRGKQPIDVNDLALIAGALGVGVHQLLPPPDQAAEAETKTIGGWSTGAERPDRPADNRPAGRPHATATTRTGYLPRRRRDR